MHVSARNTLYFCLNANRLHLLPLLLLALLAAAPALVSAQRPGSIANIHSVDFGKGGRLLGSYTEVGRGRWNEQSPSGVASFHFAELRRDDTTIYLFDASRHMNINLDLRREKVVYSQGGSPWRDLYDILPSGPPATRHEPERHDPGRHEARRAEVTGYNVLWIKVGSNGQAQFTYVKTGNNTWDELNGRGDAVHHYKVTGQSQETLALYDYTRNMTLNLDFRSKTSLSVVPGRAHQNQYEIVSAGDEEMPDNRGGYDR